MHITITTHTFFFALITSTIILKPKKTLFRENYTLPDTVDRSIILRLPSSPGRWDHQNLERLLRADVFISVSRGMLMSHGLAG